MMKVSEEHHNMYHKEYNYKDCIFCDKKKHLMKWERITRETGLTEYVCEHGCGHPDVNQPIVKKDLDMVIHGCDGCCLRDDFPGRRNEKQQ